MDGAPLPHSRAVAIVLTLSWVLSLLLPVATLAGPEGETVRGYELLVDGWLGPLVAQFGWYANPLFLGIISWLRRDDGTGTGRSFVVFAALLSLCTLNAAFWHDIVMDEGGSERAIGQLHAGYFIWIVSMATAAIVGGWTGIRRDRWRRDMGMI